MSVIRTDKWLLNCYEKPVELCKKITNYFEGVSAAEIYDYFALHGMYRHPVKKGLTFVENLQKNNVWEIVKDEEHQLQTQWKGPEVPIFVLPANTTERNLKKEYNGKSGLAFNDKLFLFVSETNTKDEIKALFTHEYHHVCRLANYKKDEKDFELLDTIIMEGLAEYAVRERLGEELTAAWTTLYSEQNLERMWRRIILPYIYVPTTHRKHRSLLYGLHMYPKMAGYCVGYYLVERYANSSGLTTEELMTEPPEKIAGIPSKK